MRKTVYGCDQCLNEIGNKKHLSLYLGHTSGIAIPPEGEKGKWTVKEGVVHRTVHFCTTEHLKEYFDEKMKAAVDSEDVESEYFYTVKEASEILGKENVHGMDDLKKVFQGHAFDLPIPFTREDLAKAKERNEILILCINEIDGKPLTMKHLNEIVQPLYDKKNLGKFLFDRDWYEKEDFYRKDTMQFGWKLISKECIPNSKNKNFNNQEEIVKEHKGYKRATALEVAYLIAVRLLTTGERLYENEYAWTESATSDGLLVYVGCADREGVYVYGYSRGHSGGGIGVCLSR